MFLQIPKHDKKTHKNTLQKTHKKHDTTFTSETTPDVIVVKEGRPQPGGYKGGGSAYLGMPSSKGGYSGETGAAPGRRRVPQS